jgi:hypothetical protein
MRNAFLTVWLQIFSDIEETVKEAEEASKEEENKDSADSNER